MTKVELRPAAEGSASSISPQLGRGKETLGENSFQISHAWALELSCD